MGLVPGRRHFIAGVAACLAGGALSDVLIRRWGPRWGRRTIGTIGMALAALAIVSTTWAESIPMLGFLRGDPNPPLVTFQRYRLVHGWAVVFDPLDRVPEAPEDCFVVWVSELGSSLPSRQPRSLEFEFTLPLTGGLWPKELQDAEQ